MFDTGLEGVTYVKILAYRSKEEPQKGRELQGFNGISTKTLTILWFNVQKLCSLFY